MPDFGMIAEKEISDGFDLDFRVVYVEARQPGGPLPDNAGGPCACSGSGDSDGVCSSCDAPIL